jgi:excisionase family DNA binding protein
MARISTYQRLLAGMQHRSDAEMTIATESPAVLTVDEVAEILRIGRISAYQAIERGEIPSVRVGRRILVPRIRFEQMLNPSATPKSGIDIYCPGKAT